VVLAQIAEVEVRGLHVRWASSLRDYCVRILHFSEDAAYKRIQAARAGRDFPVLFEAVASGRLHLGGACLLAPHLNAHNADDLIEEASWKSKAEIERLLARRFPKSEEIPLVERLVAPGPLAPSQASPDSETLASTGAEHPLAPGQVVSRNGDHSRSEPVAHERYALHLTMGRATYEQLQTLKALLAHQVPSGDLAEILDRAMAIAIRELEKRKFGAGVRRRRGEAVSAAKPRSRHIPSAVREQVWKRDGGQCTFVCEDGRRCAEQRVEFDHVLEFARGGESTVANLRLRCHAHNQHAAERAYGREFMQRKRAEARRAAAENREHAKAAAARRAERQAIESDPELSVVPWLRRLGFPLDRARALAERCEDMKDATLEERVAAALRLSGMTASPRRSRPPAEAA
jgi:5-methylcytosine-specific restriction endonuclease McrA